LVVLAAAVTLVAVAAALPAAAGGAALGRPVVPIVIAGVDLVIVTVLVARGLDVRMVLLLGAVPLFAVTRGLTEMVVKIAGEMTNVGTVVPICSAMGFAFVLSLTECDQHLVRLLTRPLRRVRLLLVPGGILAGYLINTTIVSQAGTAAVLGPILIPLLRAGGLPPASAGGILLLGSSMGGELFNPGAVEMRKLAELTATSGPQVVGRSAPFNLLACATALGTFWLLSGWRGEGRAGAESAVEPIHEGEPPCESAAHSARTEPRPPEFAGTAGMARTEPRPPEFAGAAGMARSEPRPPEFAGAAGMARTEPRDPEFAGAAGMARSEPRPPESAGVARTEPRAPELSLIKATVPVVPIVLLVLDGALGPFVFSRPSDGPARILAAMLIGVVAAGLTSLSKVGGISAALFEGAGYAYTHVISLIVVASTFAAAIERSGLIAVMLRELAPWPTIAIIVATAAPWSLAVVSGTGIAPAVAIMEFFVPMAGSMGIDPIRLGTLTAMGAHFGRTMSPAAAVVMVSSRLSATRAPDLIRRVAVPLLTGGTVLVAAVLLGFI
jgi:DcuC family C4-dicarboxylate transporter